MLNVVMLKLLLKKVLPSIDESGGHLQRAEMISLISL